MTTYKIKLATENPALVCLAAQEYDKSFTNFDYAAVRGLSKNLAAAIAGFYAALTGEDLQDDQSVFAVKSNQGVFNRIYPPSLNVDPTGENDFILVFGGKKLPLNYLKTKGGQPNKKGQLEVAKEGYELEASFIVSETNGFPETVFQMSLLQEEKDNFITFDCAVRYSETLLKEEGQTTLKKLDATELTAKFKREPEALKAILGNPVEFDDDAPAIKVNDLPVGDYKVVHYKTIPTSYGETNLLTVIGAVNEAGEPTQMYRHREDKDSEDFTLTPLEKVKVWSAGAINTTLSLQPVVTEEKPATLKVVAVDQGKKKNRATCTLIVEMTNEITEEELNFDF